MPRLLVIDDNEQHLRWLIDLLQKKGSALGYEIKYYTKNWNRAIRLLRNSSSDIDIVITDLQDAKTMRFDGFEIIREAHRKGKSVIAVSSYLDDEAHMRDVLVSGADFYVKKPFKPKWRKWNEYTEELYRSAELSMYFALKRLTDELFESKKLTNDLFLSYSSKDMGLAEEVKKTIQAKGFSCFMAGKDLTPASEWEPRIRNMIVSSRLVLLLITPNSMNSPWVLCEAGAAWGMKKTILPLLAFTRPEQLPEIMRKHQCLNIETKGKRKELIATLERILL